MSALDFVWCKLWFGFLFDLSSSDPLQVCLEVGDSSTKNLYPKIFYLQVCATIKVKDSIIVFTSFWHAAGYTKYYMIWLITMDICCKLAVFKHFNPCFVCWNKSWIYNFSFFVYFKFVISSNKFIKFIFLRGEVRSQTLPTLTKCNLSAR